MKIAICDDEKEICNCIERNVLTLYPDMDIVQFNNGQSLLNAEADFDILFLDIQMDGMDGMETARQLRKSNKNTLLIFVTAIEDYVFQSFDVGAFHFLVKPFEKGKFYRVLEAAIKNRNELNKTEEKEEANISIKIGKVTQKIYHSQILYLEVFNRKIVMHKLDGSLEFYGKLNELEKSLGENFVRPHRAYLINIRYIQSYDAGSITLENGETMLMAKNKYADFVRSYMRYTVRINSGRDRDVT